MPRVTIRKTEPKGPTTTDRRRPPLFRPKSRSDTGGKMETSRLRGDGGGSSDEEALTKQNQELRHRLQEEASLYRRRLDTYKQAQQNQAALVSRLQAKVLQYRQRCSELESQLADTEPTTPYTSLPSTSALEEAQQHLRDIREERINDLDHALRRLDDEKRRNEHLSRLTHSLREQLEESHATNEALTNDLQKLTNDFETLREEMIIKDDEWKDEEQAFNDYYSAEHTRLLNLWKDVVSVKRLFVDMQTTTAKDLSNLKGEIGSVGRDLTFACTRMDRNVVLESLFGGKEKYQFEQELADLRTQVHLLESQRESSAAEMRTKEERIQHLLHDVQTLEDRCVEAEQNIGQVSRMQEDIDILQNALKDIAHTLIQDAEISDPESTSHLHLTPSASIPQKSPKRGGARSQISPAAFAESTISAVQAALHKYQSLIHELQVKLQSNREQLLLVRKQHEAAEENVTALEGRVTDLVAQLDTCHAQSSHFSQERDMLQKTVEGLRAEKAALERNRIEITTMIDSLNVDYEKLQRDNARLHKDCDVLHDEKLFLQTEIDRLNQEASLREISLRGEEDRCSRMREELLGAREDLNKLYLAHDLLEQQKLEGDSVIGTLEKSKADLEMQLDRILNERTDCHESLLRKENLASNLEFDKKKLQEELKKVEDEKMALHVQCNDQQNDIQSLKKELLQAEQTRLDLEADKMSLHERIKFVEIDKGKVEMELGQIARERSDLSNQLTVLSRKKEALNEELMRTKQKLEQCAETNARINRNLEDLVKECEERQCQLDASDKENQRVQEQFAALRSEKEALEAVLFDTQTHLEATDEKKVQLEKDQQELLVKQENLKGQVAKLHKELERAERRAQEIKHSLTQQAGTKEAEYLLVITNLKKTNEENVRKLTDERERIRASLEKRMQQSVQQLGGEKDAEIRNLHEQMENLHNHIENISQQHEELLLRAENDKQQALLIAHHDHQGLQERLECARRKLEEEQENLERLRREANGKIEQDRISINQLKDELGKYRARLEEAKSRGEEDRVRLEQRIEELRIERDAAQTEVENVKVQLHLLENKVDDVGNQLHETIRKLKEAENNADALRKELTDVRRQLTDSNYEKEKYHATNKELREHIKRNESEKREQTRQIEEAFQKIANLEEIRQSLENEKSRLQSVVRDAEKAHMQSEHRIQSLEADVQRAHTAAAQQQSEEKELQARLLNETEEKDRLQQELHQLKKQMSELEGHLEQTRQELGRTRSSGAQVEQQWHVREQDLLVHLEDARVREKRLEDQKHNLEVCLVDATQQIQELKARLGGSEGKVRSLDGQLAQLDSSKRDLEQKLSSVVSTLRRIAGIQFDGSVTVPYRLLSPSRRWSPARGQEQDGGAVDVDPEAVRKGVRSLMQQVAQIERERDDYKAQVTTVKQQLHEAQQTQTKGDSKLHKAMQNLKVLQEEKGSLENQLGQKHVALQSHVEVLQRKSEEARELRDKVAALELSVNAGQEEKLHYEDKIEKLKNALGRLEGEKHSLLEELNRTEGRSTKLELQRMSLEGDVKRLQMILQEKDTTIDKLKEKCDAQTRSIISLEERCVSLKSTIDQLNISLEKSSSNEHDLKTELQHMQKTLLDTSSSSHSNAEKLKQMQKALANAENERRVLCERLDVSQQNLAELRRTNQMLQDQVARLNTEIANNEVQRAGLESQLRLSHWPSAESSGSSRDEDLLRQLQVTQRERSELRGKVDSLTAKVHQLEADKRSVERQGGKSVTFSAREKYDLDTPTTDSTLLERCDHLEQDNRELRTQIAKLEALLADKEAELNRMRGNKSWTEDRDRKSSSDFRFDRAEVERFRAAQLQAERLLEAREQSHRQQVARLEHQLQTLREQLNQEIKRRQQYVLRSSRTGREMQQLRQALGDSLRTVSQDPSLDALLLEHETRKLDSTLAHTASLPPALSSFSRSMTPQPK